MIRYFTVAARASKTELSDLLIAASAHLSGYDHVLTFDRAAARFDLFERI